MERNGKKAARRGSALLIVLGFLSFMIVSAVSFAVYMRIERQASSNYRHTIMARHMLNAALCRAVDEIDSDLRDESVCPYKKFPSHWKFRVRPAAVEDSAENGQNARVLSLEGLSYIPSILVNDVRRYAFKMDADNDYWGAKWRSLSMPVRSLGDESGQTHSADGEAVVGRYAYVCVNVSDMLDVNSCRASIRNASSNHVSLAHLFDSDTARATFDDNFLRKDFKYETLSDFYACMKQHGDATFGSPYYDWLTVSSEKITGGSGFGSDKAKKNVLIAGSKALPEPTNSACMNLYNFQPSQINDDFVSKLIASLDSNPSPGNLGAAHNYIKSMITDYLDEDSTPTRLNVPSVEMVPMISQLTFVPMGGLTAQIAQRNTPTASDPNKKMYYLELGDGGQPYGTVFVEAVWPFPYYMSRSLSAGYPNTFRAQVQAYIKVDTMTDDRFHKTQEFTPAGGPAEGELYYKLASSPVALTFNTGNMTTPDDQGANVNHFYCSVPVILPNFSKEVDIIDTDGDAQNFFVGKIGQNLSVSLIVFAQITDSSGAVVDQSPKIFDGSTATIANDEFMATPKIFFETNRQKISASMATGVNLIYQWKALEVPDPRFNYKASNWVQWQQNSALGDGADGQTPCINKSTTDLLNDGTGRDSDIFMSVADSGYFQSPGELGFIVRPFNFNIGGTSVDFSDTARTADDKDYMFRTIRIYDHGSAYPHDKIYENFVAAAPSASLDGARVNPLSDIDTVLEAAITRTPYDYWLASQMGKVTGSAALSALGKYSYDSDTSAYKSEWQTLSETWSARFKTARAKSVNGKTVEKNWDLHMRDVYGLYDTFGWYGNGRGNELKVFDNGTDTPGTLSSLPLHEIDRKMLYSFSIDSFSDRQQLFLYFLRAEAIPPGFGASSASSGGKSLAGGRAVALVWRDPYPAGYKLNSDGTENLSDVKPCTSDSSENCLNRESPWLQYGADATRNAQNQLHDHRILFFKELRD